MTGPTTVSKYKEAGVDIEAGESFVNWIASVPEDPALEGLRSKVVSGIGGFSGIFDAGFPGLESPCLVASTDGVGTKLKLAIELDDVSTIGQDLVAMCVNDLLCCGAKPLFFLDYYATSKLDLERAKSFLLGLKRACNEAQTLLLGGETAEMPGLYSPGDFDCAGFAVGVVDRSKILGKHRVQAGDVAFGIRSSGFHSNGFSLVRKLFSGDSVDVKRQLLTPTRLYTKDVMNILSQSYEVHAISHVTGGGVRNLDRVLGDDLEFHLENWPIEGLFLEAQKRGDLTEAEVREVFNCGVGMVVFVAAVDARRFEQWSSVNVDGVFRVGEVVHKL